MKKTKDGRIGARRIFQVITVAVLLLCAAGGIIATQFFISDCGLFGYSARIVMSSSMERNAEADTGHEVRDLPVRSLIVIQLVPTEEGAREAFYSQICEGDVLTFSYRTIDGTISVTHRVKQIERKESGFTITLGGDNGAYAATQVIDTADAESENRIVGKVVFHSFVLGVLICMLRDPLFLIVIGIIILSVLLQIALRRERSVKGAKNPPHWRET